jgi:hypothetical protein
MGKLKVGPIGIALNVSADDGRADEAVRSARR